MWSCPLFFFPINVRREPDFIPLFSKLLFFSFNRPGDDVRHWSKFQSFTPLLVSDKDYFVPGVPSFLIFSRFQSQVEVDGGKSLDLSNYPYIFMVLYNSNSQLVIEIKTLISQQLWNLRSYVVYSEMEGAALRECWHRLWLDYRWLLLCMLLLQWWLHQWLLLWS